MFCLASSDEVHKVYLACVVHPPVPALQIITSVVTAPCFGAVPTEMALFGNLSHALGMYCTSCLASPTAVYPSSVHNQVTRGLRNEVTSGVGVPLTTAIAKMLRMLRR